MINFYEGKENKPHRLFVQSERVTIHDRIVFTEARYAVDDKCVHLYGVLADESVGIENSKDKTWKLNGHKAMLSFYRDKKPTWNKEINKFEDKEVEPSENYLYGFAKNVLENINGDTISIIVSPYVNPQFLEEMKNPQDEATISYWEGKVKNTIIATSTDSKLLTDSDKEVLKAASTNFSGGKTYQKPESESEKLEARWEFLKHHLRESYPINSLLELGTMLAPETLTPEGKESQLELKKTIELIMGMWK
jgi:hypothetical protein